MVVAYGPNGYGFAITNSLGQYSITQGLPAGTYTVEAIAEYYIVAKIENVAVVTGQETSNIDLYLSASGGISGRVTDAVSGAPLQNIIVTAFPSSGSGEYGWYAITDANGNYSILTNLSTGTYNVSVLFPQGYIMESIDLIDVTAGFEVKGVDFALARSGIISGRVTATPSGAPLGNATVVATSDDGNYFGFTQTNATGHYRISSGLGTGTYTVTASAPGYTEEQITGVSVTVNQVTSGIDFQLTPIPPEQSGRISGTVQGDENIIPEVQNPPLMLLTAVVVVTILAKILNIKTKRYQQLRNKAPTTNQA